MARGRRIAAVAVALFVVAGACGGGDDKKDAADDGAGSTSGAARDEATTSSTGPAGGVGSPGAASGGTTTTRPGSGSSSAGGAGATTTSSTASKGPTTVAASKFAAPGSYVYNRTGKRTVTGLPEQSLNGEGRLRVDPPNGNDQHSAVDYGDGGTEQTVRPRAGGIDLVYLKVTQGGASWEFRPSPVVLFAPDPASVGSTWKWRITSTDGALTIDASFKVVRNETVTIGGEAVPTAVVEGTSQ
jgi:hypothetical protein